MSWLARLRRPRLTLDGPATAKMLRERHTRRQELYGLLKSADRVPALDRHHVGGMTTRELFRHMEELPPMRTETMRFYTPPTTADLQMGWR